MSNTLRIVLPMFAGSFIASFFVGNYTQGILMAAFDLIQTFFLFYGIIAFVQDIVMGIKIRRLKRRINKSQ